MPNVSQRQSILEYLRTTVIPAIIAGPTYNLTVKTIERGRRNFESLADNQFPAVFIPTSHEKRSNRNQIEFNATLQAVLVGYVKNSKASVGAAGTGTQLDMDKLIQDVTTALEADPTLGGRVKWLEITDVATDEGDLTPVGGFVLSVSMEYVGTRKAP